MLSPTLGKKKKNGLLCCILQDRLQGSLDSFARGKDRVYELKEPPAIPGASNVT